MVENLLARGGLGGPPLTLEMVREFGTTNGCHHPSLQGMESGWQKGGVADGPMFHHLTRGGLSIPILPAALEFTLNNGSTGLSGIKIGLETGDPRQFTSFEEFREVFRKQVIQLVRILSLASNIGEMAALQPTLFTSALTENCIEKGLPRERGGALYNVGYSGNLIGSVDVGNSLAAIEQLVFDEKKVTMDQLIQALDNNYEGFEEIRKMCLKAPKFGNDDDRADEQIAWVTHLLSVEAEKYKTTYGGRRFSKLTPLSEFVPAGLVVEALPSGRSASQPLADALSPTPGSDVNGPTAVLKSAGKVNNAEVSLGSTLNMKIDPTVFEKDDGFKRLADFIRVFIDQKVDQIQFNVVSADTLKAAQRDPENHKDLVVKVAGYNARFIDLHKELQDSIIARTEHQL
jgi:formate C-acetyltransferase